MGNIEFKNQKMPKDFHTHFLREVQAEEDEQQRSLEPEQIRESEKPNGDQRKTNTWTKMSEEVMKRNHLRDATKEDNNQHQPNRKSSNKNI